MTYRNHRGARSKAASLRDRLYRDMVRAGMPVLCTYCGGELVLVRSVKSERKLEEDDTHLTYVNNGVLTKKLILTVEHIIPLSQGGTSTKENLAFSCVPCNREASYRHLPDDRHHLVVNNQGLVKWQVKRMIASGLRQNTVATDVDELIAVGFIGLIKAAIDFDESKGAAFSTYAELNIRHAVLTHVKKESALKRGNFVGKLDIHAMERDEDMRPPVSKDPGPVINAMARDTLRILPGRERTAAWMRSQGYEVADIALELAVSPERARQILVSAARRINGEKPAAPSGGCYRVGNRSSPWSGG